MNEPRLKTRKCVACGTLMIEESPNTEVYECFTCEAKEYPTMEAFIADLPMDSPNDDKENGGGG